MKKTILLFALTLCGAFIVNAQTNSAPATATTTIDDETNVPDIAFEKDVIDYGTIEYGANGDCEFKFTNTGKKPLIIYNALGSCQCTVPTYPKAPIKPGETGVIKVHYNTMNAGSFDKSVTISSNAKVVSKTLKIKGVVKPAPVPVSTGTATGH